MSGQNVCGPAVNSWDKTLPVFPDPVIYTATPMTLSAEVLSILIFTSINVEEVCSLRFQKERIMSLLTAGPPRMHSGPQPFHIATAKYKMVSREFLAQLEVHASKTVLMQMLQR